MFGSFVCIIEGILIPFFGFWSSVAARLDCKKQYETLYYFYNFLVCDLLLAALADKSFISSLTVNIFSRFFHTAFKVCCISMRHETKFLKIWFPPSLGNIILPAASKEFLFKAFFLGPVPVRLPPLKTPFDLQKVLVKPVVFQYFHFSDPLGSSMHQNCFFI